MASYCVWVVCDECSDTHWLDGLVELSSGPPKITTVEAFFGTECLPSQLRSLVNGFTFCHKVKRPIPGKELTQIFLVPQ
jgi:hypothetical protein